MCLLLEHNFLLLIQKIGKSKSPSLRRRKFLAGGRGRRSLRVLFMYLRLQKHYIDERPTGILARLLDLHNIENSFDGDWSKYESRMLSAWHVLHSSVAKYSIEELQVLKCLIGVINNIPDRSPLEHWRSWAQNYLLNHCQSTKWCSSRLSI